MCQMDNETIAAASRKAVQDRPFTGSRFTYVYKTLWVNKSPRSSGLRSTIFGEYRWAPGWNAPMRRNPTTRDEVGMHAFVHKSRNGDGDSIRVPVLAETHGIVHYGTDSFGVPTVLATRLFLPAETYRAALRGVEVVPGDKWLRKAIVEAGRVPAKTAPNRGRLVRGVKPKPAAKTAKKRKK